MKIVRNSDEEYITQAKMEFTLLKEVRHGNIMRMHQLFFNEARSTLYFVMELCKGPSLSQFVQDFEGQDNGIVLKGQLPLQLSIRLLKLLLSALIHIHQVH